MTDALPISRFPVPDLANMPEDIQNRILAVQEKSGFIPNVFLVLAHRPDEFRAFFAYHDALMERPGNLTKAEREMVVVATSSSNQCQYCIVAHGAILRIRAKKNLSEDQRDRTRALFEEMRNTAVPLGNEVLAKEGELDEAFASGRIDDAALRRILAEIGRLQGELRYTHLKYHLAMRGVLSSDQIATYNRLHGYKSGKEPAPAMPGHHSH